MLVMQLSGKKLSWHIYILSFIARTEKKNYPGIEKNSMIFFQEFAFYMCTV